MRLTQKRMRDGKVNHLQNTYTNLRIRPKQELFPTEWQQKLSKTQNCTNFTGLWYWTTNPVGAIQTRNFFQKHEIKHNTSIPYKHIQLHKQTNHLEHPVQQKQNTTHWIRIIKDNDKPDYSSCRQTTTHTRQSRILFSQTSVTNGIPSPTFLTRKVLTV